MKTWILALVSIFALAACGSPTNDTSNAKPSADPDSEVTGKADRLSNRYTTIAGELALDDIVQSKIDFPDWFHGYTIEMKVGQEVQFTTWADKVGIVRLYGPSHRTNSNGEPKFRRSLVREVTEDNGGRENNAFVYEPIESGTYMILYGPMYEWESKYEISAKCLAGCEPIEVDAKELDGNRDKFVGDLIKVTGYVGSGPVGCTKRACSVDNMCCNMCQSSERLFAQDPETSPRATQGFALELDGEQLSCKGDECDRVQTCSVERGQYEIVGRVVKGEFELYLDIESMDLVAAAGDCQDHADCGSDAWCRNTDWNSGVKTCVPYAGESESCGGFAPPQYVNACSPELSCVYRPFVADAPGTCRNNLTVAELVADPARWNGVRVNVDGFINNDFPICTLRACDMQNPCCNACGAGQKLADSQGSPREALELEQNGETFGCGGNECTVMDHCTVQEPGQFRVVGVFEQGQYGHRINVETYISLDSL